MRTFILIVAVLFSSTAYADESSTQQAHESAYQLLCDCASVIGDIEYKKMEADDNRAYAVELAGMCQDNSPPILQSEIDTGWGYISRTGTGADDVYNSAGLDLSDGMDAYNEGAGWFQDGDDAYYLEDWATASYCYGQAESCFNSAQSDLDNAHRLYDFCAEKYQMASDYFYELLNQY